MPLILILLWLSPAFSQAGVWEEFHPVEWKKHLYKQYLKQDVRMGATLFSVIPTDLLALSGQYRYSVSDIPSERFIRTDAWRVHATLPAGTLLLAQVNVGRELQFSRVFDDKTEALKALPRTPLDLPLNAKAADGLSVGDSVSIPLQMGFILGAGMGPSLPFLEIGGQLGYLMAGEFQFKIEKISADWLRVRIAPYTGEALFARGAAGIPLQFAGLGPHGVVDINSPLEKAIGLNFFGLNHADYHHEERWAFEYLFNLKWDEARDALDALMNANLKLSPLSGLSLPPSLRNLEGFTFSVAQRAEELAEADKALPFERRRISYDFQGHEEGSRDRVDFYLGVRALKRENSRSLSFYDMNIVSEGDAVVKSYRFQRFHQRKQWESLFAHLKEEESLKISAIWEEGEFQGVAFDVTLRDRQVTSGDRSLLRWLSVLPHLSIDAKWQSKRVDTTLRLVFSPELFASIARFKNQNPVGFRRYLNELLQVKKTNASFTDVFFSHLNWIGEVPEDILTDQFSLPVRDTVSELLAPLDAGPPAFETERVTRRWFELFDENDTAHWLTPILLVHLSRRLAAPFYYRMTGMPDLDPESENWQDPPNPWEMHRQLEAYHQRIVRPDWSIDLRYLRHNSN